MVLHSTSISFTYDVVSNMAFMTPIAKKWLSVIVIIYSELCFIGGDSIHPHDVNVREGKYDYFSLLSIL